MNGEQGRIAALEARVAELEAELAAQKDASRRLDAVLVAVPSIVMHLDERFSFLGISRPVAGYSEEDVRGTHFLSHVPESERSTVERVLRSVLDSRRPASFTTFGPGANGEMAMYESYVAPVIGVDGRIELIVVAIDVTTQRKRDDALLERDRIISVACDATGIGIWVLDFGTNRVTWNLGMHTLTGVDVPLAMDAYRDRLVHPGDRELVTRPFPKGSGVDTFQTVPYRIVRPNGEVRWVMTSGRLHRDDVGEPETLIGATVDVTDHRVAEDARAHGERLAAVGRLAAGIAHDFNNHLATMLPVLEMLRHGRNPPREELLDDAIHAGRRGADLVRQLLDYSRRRDSGAFVVERFEPVVERAIAMCATLLDKSVGITLESRIGETFVACDAGSIEQGVVNLVVNARDAIVDTGRGKGSIRVTLDLEPGETRGRVVLRVIDDGPGMDATTRARIFEPFYTTKEAGRGTGLGLSITHAMVEAHGGTIVCESTDGAGTTFTLRFPSAPSPKKSERPESGELRRDSLRSRPMRILLCDDDEGVREVVATWLDHMGHEVETAAGFEEALTKLGSIDSRDLILLDRSLLDVHSARQIAQVRAASPKAFVVYFTGDDVPDEEIVLVDHLLPKPPSEQTMDAMLEALFGT